MTSAASSASYGSDTASSSRASSPASDTDAFSRTHSSGSTRPSNPPPTRKEYLAYQALLRDIHQRESLTLARQLARDDSRSKAPVVADGEQPKKRRRGHVDDGRRLSALWPLPVEELQTFPVSLDEAMQAAAESLVRRHMLRRPDYEMGNQAGDTSLRMPTSLVEQTKMFINSLLTNLAAMRAVSTDKARKSLTPMGRDDVLAAHILSGLSVQSSSRASHRLREVFGSESPDDDLFAHRLGIVDAARSRIVQADLDTELYESPVPKPKRPKKPHQSKEELEERAARRRLRQEKRRARDATKADKAKRKAERKDRKREQRRARRA